MNSMRNLIFYITLILISFSNYCGNAQEGKTDSNEEEKIIELFTKYCNLMGVRPISTPANILYEKLDSIYKDYCTDKFRIESKGWFDDGHSLLTGDWGMDKEALNTLKVIKDTSNSHVYIVTYTTNSEDPYNRSIKVKVCLRLFLVLDGGSYKIDEVVESEFK